MEKQKNNEKRKQIPFQQALIGREKDHFVENLSMLISSGMTIVEALMSISSGIKSRIMKRIVSDISNDVEAGSPLWKALDKQNLFKPSVISLVKIGEQSGKLADNLYIVSLQEEKNRNFKSKIQSAMMYPVLVMSIMVIVGIGIAWFILPKLSEVFSQLKLDLPAITKVLIGLGDFLAEFGAIAIPITIFVMLMGFYFIFGFPKTKFIGQTILFHTPIIKRLIMEIELSRLGYLFGTLLQAGVPIVDSIESLTESADFPQYKKLYAHMSVRIRDGNSFRSSLKSFKKSEKLIPVQIQQMIVTGERSGNLSDMFVKIGKTFENKIDQTTKNLTVVLEPILLVFVWMGVVGIALAVILPIYSLIGGLNAGGVQPQPDVKEPIVEVTPDVVVEDEKYFLEIVGDLEYLNVREGSSSDSDIIGKADLGNQFEYVDISDDGEWYQIILEDESTGWVYYEYIEELIDEPLGLIQDEIEGAEEVHVEEDIKLIEIVGDLEYLNVREDSSSESEVIGRANLGAVLKYVSTSEDDEWYEVKSEKGTSGWVFYEYVKELIGGKEKIQ